MLLVHTVNAADQSKCCCCWFKLLLIYPPPSVFAYPGGASMEIHQALTRSETIENILCRHEQVRQGDTGTCRCWGEGEGGEGEGGEGGRELGLSILCRHEQMRGTHSRCWRVSCFHWTSVRPAF